MDAEQLQQMRMTTWDSIVGSITLLQDAERPGRHSFAPRGNDKSLQVIDFKMAFISTRIVANKINTLQV